MKLTVMLRNLLPLLAIVGLILAPVARSPLAMEFAVAAADDAVAGMPADMPCCPDKAPASDCGKDCPLMAMCMSPCQTVPGTSLVIPYQLAGLIAPSDDAYPEHLGQAPPGRPPKA